MPPTTSFKITQYRKCKGVNTGLCLCNSMSMTYYIQY